MAHLIRHDASTSEGPSTASSMSSASSTSSDYSPRSSQTDSLRNDTVLNLFDCTDPAPSDRPSLDSDRDLFTYDSYESSGEGGSSVQYASYPADRSDYPTRASSRAGSPGPDPWEGYLGRRSRNRSRNASGTTTPNLTSDKEAADYYESHYSQTTALLNKLGGIAPPENSPLGSPVLQHQKRRPGWWARRAEKRAWAEQFESNGLKPARAPRSGRRKRSCVALFWSALLRQPWVPTQPLTILFFILLFGCFAATVTTFLMHVLSNDKQPLPWRSFCQSQRDFPHDLADSLAPVNVFVGVFSVDAAYERRQLIRSTYARLSKPIDPTTGHVAQNVQVKFILGRPRPSHARRIALEMETFNDVVVLDLKENMNRGKTHSFFRWASENATVPVYFRPDQNRPVQAGFMRADYVVKADDDTFLVLSELERHLRITPRHKTYWGYLIRNLFMAGEVYALSMDLVDYVASYAPLLAQSTGAEDKKVSKWMRMHPQASQINWVTERCWIYDHPKAGTTYSHGFLFPDYVEHIRAEGRRGLSDEEKVQRGDLLSQAYSTVSRWKAEYRKPRSDLTIEEEVEALVEGGGRWSTNNWLSREAQNARYVKADLLVFDPRDPRFVDPFAVDFAAAPERASLGIKPGVPDRSVAIPSARTTRFGKDLFRNPDDVAVVQNGRRAVEAATDNDHLLIDVHNAVIPDPEDDDEESSILDEELAVSSNASYAHVRLPPATNYQVPDENAVRFLPQPTLRFDQDVLSVRDRRMLGRRHGGTVAVHYLKRNEWFYEAALALLGRHRTWDSGHDVPVMHDACSRMSAASVDKYDLASIPIWRGVGSVEAVPALWGGARMYGSPLVHADGMVTEGRPLALRAERSAASPPSSIHDFGPLRGSPKLGYTREGEAEDKTPIDQPTHSLVEPAQAANEAAGVAVADQPATPQGKDQLLVQERKDT